MAGYIRLLWREARQATPTAAAFLLGIVFWAAFLASRVGRWPEAAILFLATLPLGVLPVWALWRVVHGMRQDYATPHAHLLLSLPVPGWQLASAKLLVAWAELAVYGAAVGAGLLLLARAAGLPSPPPTLSPDELRVVEQALLRTGVTLGLLAALLGAPAWLILTQSAWCVGRLFPRGQGLVSVLAFLSGGWLLLRAGTLAPAVLGWLPRVDLLWFPEVWDAEIRLAAVAVHPAPLVGVVGGALALFALGAWLLEHVVEP